MTIQQLAARLGVTVGRARAAVKSVYRASRPTVFTDRHVRVLRWAIQMEEQNAG